MVTGPGQGLFGPDRLAVGRLPAAPALGELGDEQEASAALVEGVGTAQVGEVELPSDTSQMRERARSGTASIESTPRR
nr:hypothetical protein [Streptomyces viridochromogenes]